MLAIQLSITVAYLVTLINVANGQTCNPMTIPSRFDNLCFRIPAGNLSNYKCDIFETCYAMAWFSTDLFKTEQLEVHLESVAPPLNAVRIPPTWLKLDIYLNASRPSDYITLECSGENSTGRANQDAKDITVVVVREKGNMNRRNLKCVYHLTPMLSLAQRVVGSYDPRNKHHFTLTYGHFTNSTTGVYDVKMTNDSKVSGGALYQFQAGVGTADVVTPAPITTTTVTVTASESAAGIGIWLTILIVVVALAIIIVLAIVIQQAISKKSTTVPDGDRWTPKPSNLNQTPALPLTVPFVNKLPPPPSHLTAKQLPPSIGESDLREMLDAQ